MNFITILVLFLLILIILILLSIILSIIVSINRKISYSGGAPKKPLITIMGLPKLISGIMPSLKKQIKKVGTITEYNEDLHPDINIHLTPHEYKTPDELISQKSLALQHASMDEWVKLIDELGKSKVNFQVAYFEGSNPRSKQKINQDILTIIQNYISSQGAAEKMLKKLGL